MQNVTFYPHFEGRRWNSTTLSVN